MAPRAALVTSPKNVRPKRRLKRSEFPENSRPYFPELTTLERDHA
jgi:hypothetical protein